jgi:hypothetical protein
MKRMAAILAAGAAVVLAGCTPVLSVNPIYTDDIPVVQPGLAGVWEEDDGTDLWVVRESGGGGYTLAIVSSKDDKPAGETYSVRLVRLGGLLFADAIENRGNSGTAIAGHLLASVALEGDKLRVAVPDAEWLEKDRPDFPLPAHSAQDGSKRPLVFTAPAAEILAFLLRCAATAGCLGEPGTLHRIR